MKAPYPPSLNTIRAQEWQTNSFRKIFAQPTIKSAFHRYYSLNPLDDSTLIRKFCNDGDAGAATELLGKYEQALYQFIWQMLRHPQDCEDAMQETFSKALRALPRYREENHFKSWLFRIGHNEAINIIRSRQRTAVTESLEDLVETDILTDHSPSASELLEKDERLRALDEAVAKLPDAEQEVLAMRLQAELSFKEIARITGAPIGTVLGRMHNAKKRLKPFLEDQSNEY
jgi:RNA polymerase sigma-70 factor (ECF subfamily)